MRSQQFILPDDVPLEIKTPRLLLRRWQPSEVEAFTQMNADPLVMKFFPRLLSANESNALAARIQQHFDDFGFGWWAVEIPGVTSFAGFIGLSVSQFDAHFTPCVEIGWRLIARYWQQGYATEGAQAALDFARRWLRIPDIVSLTAKVNLPSRRVMEEIGMTYSEADDFDHPLLPQGDWLLRHVLYRIQLTENDDQAASSG